MRLSHVPLPDAKGGAKASKDTQARKERPSSEVPAVGPDGRLDAATVRARLLKAGQVVTSVYEDKNLVVTEFPDGRIEEEPYDTP